MTSFNNKGRQFWVFSQNCSFVYSVTLGELVIEVHNKVIKLRVEPELTFDSVFNFVDVYSATM